MTVTIQIGNSDDKLSQKDWSHFCLAAKDIIENQVQEIHFHGGSAFDAPWQNVCWVCVTPAHWLDSLRFRLEELRIQYKQESVALTVGDTEFI